MFSHSAGKCKLTKLLPKIQGLGSCFLSSYEKC